MPANNSPTNFQHRFSKTSASTLTTSYVAVTAQSCWVEAMRFTNKSGSDATVTVADGNGKEYLHAVNIPAAQPPYDDPAPEGGFRFASGFQWKASANSAIDAWVRFRND